MKPTMWSERRKNKNIKIQTIASNGSIKESGKEREGRKQKAKIMSRDSN